MEKTEALPCHRILLLLIWERLRAEEEVGDGSWDGWTCQNHKTQQPWGWAKCWRHFGWGSVGKPGVLLSKVLQRAGFGWVTKNSNFVSNMSIRRRYSNLKYRILYTPKGKLDATFWNMDISLFHLWMSGCQFYFLNYESSNISLFQLFTCNKEYCIFQIWKFEM